MQGTDVSVIVKYDKNNIELQKIDEKKIKHVFFIYFTLLHLLFYKCKNRNAAMPINI